MTDRIAEIRERASKATEGPWRWRYAVGGSPELFGHRMFLVMDAVRNGMSGAITRFARRTDSLGGLMFKASEFFERPGKSVSDFQEPQNPDMQLIAHARDDIPYLLAQLDAARAEVERVKSERDSALADIAHAIKNAKNYEPDYPWSQNTASEAVWALGEGLRGMEQACDEWRIKAKGLADIARRHLLPIVTAGEAEHWGLGLAWDGSEWYAARAEGGKFVCPGDEAGGEQFILDGITHWLPAARVPGPEGAKS